VTDPTAEAREIAQKLVDDGRGYGTWENMLARALLAALDENERLREALSFYATGSFNFMRAQAALAGLTMAEYRQLHALSADEEGAS
jgi:hypothetical protein